MDFSLCEGGDRMKRVLFMDDESKDLDGILSRTAPRGSILRSLSTVVNDQSLRKHGLNRLNNSHFSMFSRLISGHS